MTTSTIVPTFAHPPVDELRGRVARLCQALEREGLDYFVSILPDNVYYLTNFANYVHERPFVLLISHQGELRFIVPKLEAEHVRVRSIGPIDLACYFEFPAPAGAGWDDVLQQCLPRGARIGCERTAPYFLIEALGQGVKASDMLDDLRMVKSEYELSRIQYASNVGSMVQADFFANAKPGTSAIEAHSNGSRLAMGALIADDPAFNLLATKVSFGFQSPDVSHDPHNFTNINMQLCEGGPHVCLFNAALNGYASEVERTFFMGHAPEAARRPFEVMLQAREAALAVARPGNLMSAVDQAANAVMRAAGYGDNLLHRAGHGMGVTGHEAPFFAEGDNRPIEENMVFTIEPGLYIPGIGGFRHSDTLCIKADGPLLMTRGPITLEELILPI